MLLSCVGIEFTSSIQQETDPTDAMTILLLTNCVQLAYGKAIKKPDLKKHSCYKEYPRPHQPRVGPKDRERVEKG